MTPIKLVIFDIAGTIIEDRGEVVTAFASALKKHDIPFHDSELQEWKGASKREVIHQFVSRESSPGPALDARVETIYSDFREILEAHYGNGGIAPIPGAVETFRLLRRLGIQIASTTGFYRELSNLIMETTGWKELFSTNISSSDVRCGRPAPYMIFRAMEATGIRSVSEVMNVGDTPFDLQAGTNAGVRGVVGVLTGFHKQERLAREPHTHLLKSVAELPELIEKQFFPE